MASRPAAASTSARGSSPRACRRRLGQQVVVESRTGAGGTIAAAQVARAAPDGYTLGFIPSSHAVTAATYKALPYNPIDDFTIVGQAIEFPFVVVTYPEHPIRTMPDLIKAARTRPRRCSAACRARARRSIC